MSKRSRIEKEILDEYLKSHRNISDRQLKRIKECIKDIDTRTYKKLARLDEKSGVTHRKNEYVNIMLKNYRRKFGESTKEYKERVYAEKNKILKNRGINATSRRTRYLTFKGFSKDRSYGKIKVKNKAKVERRMKRVKKDALKSPRKFLFNIVDNLKPSKSKIHMTTPKGFFNKLKEIKENDPKKFSKQRRRAIIVAGFFILSLSTSIGFLNNIKNQTEVTSGVSYTSSEIHINEPGTFDGNPKLEFSDPDEEISDDTEESTVDVQENDEAEIEEKTENEITESDSTTNYISTSSAIRSLISNSNIGFNTEFQMEDGLYYETPEETGDFGHYTKFQGSNLKLTYGDAIYEDGSIVKYDASSGLSIADIIKGNEGATLSYHIETADGKVLGWNSSNSNNIETSLLLGYLNQLKSYISSDDMEFINSIDLTNISQISEDNVQKISEIIQSAENTQEQSLNNSYDEQSR